MFKPTFFDDNDPNNPKRKTYIEREALIQRLEASPLIKNYLIMRGSQNLIDGIIDLIKRQPTADVVEVRHGEWIDNEDDFWVICSNCCIEILDNEMDIIDNYKYCPNCGAKMDGKEVDYA